MKWRGGVPPGGWTGSSIHTEVGGKEGGGVDATTEKKEKRQF